MNPALLVLLALLANIPHDERTGTTMKVELSILLLSLVKNLSALKIQEEQFGNKIVNRKPRSADSEGVILRPLKVLSFADDNDNEADMEGEFTSASLQRRTSLPESFTLCTAFMVDAWNSDYQTTLLFAILRGDGL